MAAPNVTAGSDLKAGVTLAGPGRHGVGHFRRYLTHDILDGPPEGCPCLPGAHGCADHHDLVVSLQNAGGDIFHVIEPGVLVEASMGMPEMWSGLTAPTPVSWSRVTNVGGS